ncbi:MAG: Fic family protein [Candidatus Diapherotrites archaeon]|nr:Fic family protein [Candidatus Diapherotrites archaeon]
MFISKRKISGKSYYYLEDRVNGKRISISLGRKERVSGGIESAFDELTQKTTLERLKISQKKFKTNILSISEQLTLERLKVDYGLLQAFFPQSFEAFKEDEFIRYAQGSASVEGNSLTQKEAALVLEKGVAVAGKKIEEIREMENMKLAADVSGKLMEVNERGIKKIHSAIMNGFDEKTPGEYRAGPMFITASEVKPPSADKIKKGMGTLFEWLGKNTAKIHPVELASEFHARFEEIHPFNDGNGRTGREILNTMLRLNGYPKAIINLENRESYIALLERVQINREYNKFSKFICLCLEKRAQEIGKIITENKKAILEKMTKKTNTGTGTHQKNL